MAGRLSPARCHSKHPRSAHAKIREMANYNSPEHLEECERDAQLVFVMTASVLRFTAMAVSRAYPEHIAVYKSVSDVLSRFYGSTSTAS
jgi:hypothetical protein